MPIKIIDSWIPWRPPCGVMPLSFTTRSQSGMATAAGQSNCHLPISVEPGRRKVSLLNELYPSQRGRDRWDTLRCFFGLMRIRGMECRSRYAEAFQKASKAVLSLRWA
jgi:hypothetical protein